MLQEINSALQREQNRTQAETVKTMAGFMAARQGSRRNRTSSLSIAGANRRLMITDATEEEDSEND